MPHDHFHSPHDHQPRDTGGLGHNHAGDAPYHLHSHLSSNDEADGLQALTAQFIEGFAQATDKAAFLRLAGVPLTIPSEANGADLKLVDVSITHQWQVGAASPAFGSSELSYLPYPGDLIRERVNCALVYVSLTERQDVDLRSFLKQQQERSHD
ncbi:MAG: hypothetical protein KTR21_11435 [Rhodobacteraceae bacterium]|nr:hypothetical protein [Paracoccaceae bacterium]